jgi:DnaJ-like protein
MQSGSPHARLRIMETLASRPEVTVILDSSGTPSSRLRSRFLERTADGIVIHATTALGIGLSVGVAGEIDTGTGPEPLLGKFRVSACKLAGIGKYKVELVHELNDHDDEGNFQQPKTGATETEDVDYYEVLQVSRKADADTIRRVFHVLAQRYHPDNKETGDQDKFRQAVDANAVLCDPERRAAHDVQLANYDKTRLHIFDSARSTQGAEAELRKRKGILQMLYGKRLTDPHDSALRGLDFAEMLGCPLEHLNFSMWYLREKKFILRSDNNKYEITWQGVEYHEAAQDGVITKRYPQLEAPRDFDL